MKIWALHDIRDHAEDIFQSDAHEPQMVYEQDRPLAVILDIALFEELNATRQQRPLPTIAELFDELVQIRQDEPIDLEIPIRQDRINAVIEEARDVFM